MPNPKTSLAAVAASGTPVGRWTVREITLGLSAVLESIQSPLDTGKKPAGIRGWIPTLYALTHTTAESERLLAAGGEEAYVKAASAWADEIPIAEARALVAACMGSAARLAAAADTGEGGDAGGNASAATAG